MHALTNLREHPFVDYVITVIAIGGGIVALKMLFSILAEKWQNTVTTDVRDVFLLM